MAAPFVLWLTATFLGIEVWAPAMGEQPAHEIGPGNVLAAASVASLVAWALLAALERVVPRHARLVWAVIAAVVLLVSLVGPVTGDGITTADRALLVVLHVLVAAVLVPVMYRTSGTGR